MDDRHHDTNTATPPAPPPDATVALLPLVRSNAEKTESEDFRAASSYSFESPAEGDDDARSLFRGPKRGSQRLQNPLIRDYTDIP